ncbi:hypothetical protein [Paenibacillus xylanexedens]|uniref:hypothetical protein n=1 Tax=Paenibacillus xylanexedens TaxID=528191 RepID=UPI001C92F979|nr:hypothetical protein [Paenibacillus xylanexedens]
MTLHLKKSWIISLITSFVLLGGVLFSPAASADAAKVATSTYSDQSYEEFKEYTTQLFALETYEAKAFTALESIDTQVTSTNRKSMYLKLTNTVIPNYTKLVSKAKQIKPTNPKLKKIHATFIKASYTQLEGYLLYQKAVSKNKVNYTLLKQGNAKVNTAGVLMNQCEQQLYAYARSLGYDN